jgi:predicted  nucleic acid-binding Zn-ribbon protein
MMLEDGLGWIKDAERIDSIVVVSFGKYELETRRLVTKSRAQ